MAGAGNDPCSAEDIKDKYNFLRKKEKGIPILQGTFPLPARRTMLVKWMHVTCEKIGFFPMTYCLATLLFDGYTDRHQVHENDMDLLAACCLLLAGIFIVGKTLQKIIKAKSSVIMVRGLNMDRICGLF